MTTKPRVNNEQSLLAEYNALRAEMNIRINIMYQIFAFTVVADGTITTIAFSTGSQLSHVGIILIYPYISFFASFIYLSNISVIHNLGKYIKEEIEPFMGDQYKHWEEAIQQHPHYGYHLYYFLAGLIVFVLTPSMALLTYLVYYPLRPISLFFYLAIAFILVILVFIIHSISIINPKFRGMIHYIKCHLSQLSLIRNLSSTS